MLVKPLGRRLCILTVLNTPDVPHWSNVMQMQAMQPGPIRSFTMHEFHLILLCHSQHWLPLRGSFLRAWPNRPPVSC